MKRNKNASRKRKSEPLDDAPKAPRNERLEELIIECNKLPIYEDEPDEEASPSDPTLMGRQFRQVKYIECYIAAGGNLTAASRLAKVSRAQAWRWFKDEWFQKQLNERMHEWELLLRAKMFQLAMNGNTTMLIFLSKFLNPFYDDNYRTKVLLGEMAQTLYERYPIPEPQFLPSAVPQRFGNPRSIEPANAQGTEAIPTSLVHHGGNQ